MSDIHRKRPEAEHRARRLVRTIGHIQLRTARDSSRSRGVLTGVQARGADDDGRGSSSKCKARRLRAAPEESHFSGASAKVLAVGGRVLYVVTIPLWFLF